MVCVVLVAGYATRLYPLTKNFPKPLLNVKEKAILNWLLDDIDTTGEITRYVIVSNHVFFEQFQAWAETKTLSVPIKVLDDGTTGNENRLGAVRDIQFAVDWLKLDDDLLILAGDNLLDFSLAGFIRYACEHASPCVMRYREPNLDRLCRSGVVETDASDRIIRMEEKPEKPFSSWCQPPFFYFPKAAVHTIADAIAAGCATDAPGSLTAWLCKQTVVYSMKMPGFRYDIGNLESYDEVRRSYMGIRKHSDGNSNKIYLVTGAAGFIGFHLCKKLLKGGSTVVGFDNLNSYYDPALKDLRLEILNRYPAFTFVKGDLAEKAAVSRVFIEHKPDIVINLAAQAGVRYSITHPDAYIESNIIGFFNILEACRHAEELTEKKVEHLVYASSSSVYGNQKKTPFSTDDDVSYPISLYAATKKSNELMAYTYSHLYGLPTTGLRFFTVYGPYGRPDMAYFKFAEKMVKGETIQIFNHGDMKRDFTYINDIVQGILSILGGPQKDSGAESSVPACVYNIGNNKPEDLLHFVNTLEKLLQEEGVIREPAKKEFLPMQPGDVYQTYADVEPLMRDFNFKPDTPIETGLWYFVKWYKEYHHH